MTETSGGKILPVDPVKAAFKNEFQSVEDSIDEYMENNTVVSDSLWLAFKALTEENIEGVKVTDVTRIDSDDSVKSSDKGYLHFRIIAEENGKVVKIGVAAILQANGKFIGAALKRLIDYNKFGFTRGCLVRSHKINKGSAIPQECVRKLLKEQGGEWVTLLKEHIKPLIAISFVLNKAENYDLTEEQVYDFIKETRLAVNNPLVREILSDPSGQEPLGLIDDELPISIPRRDADAYNEEIAL